jgi:hypothetical protein
MGSREYGLDPAMVTMVAQEVKAVGDEQARDLRKQALQAFGRLAGAQAEHQVGADPAERFIELLRAALSSGRAHIADPDGNRPRDSQVWGWRNWEEPEGERIGFFNGVHAADALLPAAMKLAGELAAGPTLAHAMTKKMLHLEWNMGVNEAIDAEARAQAGLMKSNDFRRAFEAFAAKQKPVFEGD